MSKNSIKEYKNVLQRQQYENDNHYNLRTRLVTDILQSSDFLTPYDANAISMALLDAAIHDTTPTDEMDRLISYSF